MYISRVSNFYNISTKLGFKGNDSTSFSDSSKNPDETASCQNNSPEVFIPTEQYLSMTLQGQLNRMEEAAKDSESSLSKTIKSMNEALEGLDTSDGDKDYEDGFGFLGDMGESMAEMTLFSLEASTDFMQEAPDELKGKIPKFFTSDANSFIQSIERNISEQETVDFSEIQMPDTDDLNVISEYEGVKEEYKEVAAELLEQMQAMFKDGTMAAILEQQKALVEVLKTTKKDKLNEIVTKMNDRMNYMLYQAINAGFDRNPREVLNILTMNSMMTIEPISKDNGDGTSTYIYPGTSPLKVIKNNKNGDFVSAECMQNGKPAISVQFRKDGSIKLLNYLNSMDNSEVSVETNTDNNKIRICKACEGGILERIFKKEDDGSLKQISAKVVLR